VWHLVGVGGGGYEARKKIMRAWGAWHYPLVDSLPDPDHFFPMDRSRVLAFDQRTAAALRFADPQASLTPPYPNPNPNPNPNPTPVSYDRCRETLAQK